MTTGTINLQSLPSELKKQAASFLSIKDVHSLNQTSRALHADLCLSTLSPAFQLYSSQNWKGDALTGDHPLRGPRRGASIPIFFGSAVHSITLTCTWRDQGWGNRKGKVFVLGFPNDTGENHRHRHHHHDPSNNSNNNNHLTFSNGRLVYQSQIAQHEEASLKFSFKPRRNESYHLWIQAGGGGGHELRLQNLLVHTAVMDDRYRSLAKTFQALSNMGVVSPLPPSTITSSSRSSSSNQQPQTLGFKNGQERLLLAVIASLKAAISRNEAPDLILSQFLASNHDIEVNEATLTALEDLVQYMQHYHRSVNNEPSNPVLRAIFDFQEQPLPQPLPHDLMEDFMEEIDHDLVAHMQHYRAGNNNNELLNNPDQHAVFYFPRRQQQHDDDGDEDDPMPLPVANPVDPPHDLAAHDLR
jgi:hypothetical protein